MPSGTAERPGRGRILAGAALVGAAYFISGKLGLRLAVVHEAATAVWAPAGIALAGYLLCGRKIWPAVFAAAFLVNVTTLRTVLPALGIAAGNTLSGILGAWLLERRAGGRRAFHDADGIFLFAALAALLSTAVAATAGACSLTIAGSALPGRFAHIWVTWWLGDAMGILLVTPLVVLWATPDPERPRKGTWERLAFAAALAAVGGIVFGGWAVPPESRLPVSFVALPVLVWAAFRLGPRMTSTASVLLAVIALGGTLSGHGPFVRENRNETLLLLQSFMGVTATTALAMAVAVEDRRRRMKEIDARKADLAAYQRLLTHDLSTVMASMLALLERLLLQADGTLTPRQEDFLRRTQRQALDMNRMTENARLLMRIRERGEVPAPEAVDVQALLRKTIETVRALHFDRPFDVEIETEGTPPAEAPPFLESILVNLVDNAVRHSKRGTRPALRIRADEKEGVFRVAVRGGSPPPPERMELLFDPEMKGRREGGHGLGLTLVREIVERAGGTLRVGSSIDPAAGEVFQAEVLMPLRKSAPNA